MSNSTALVQKLWNYCSILPPSPTSAAKAWEVGWLRRTGRDDGLSYGDYVEQLTFLLFLKMADEQSRLRGTPSAIPAGKDWPSLLEKNS